jgi:hypothetical protein
VGDSGSFIARDLAILYIFLPFLFFTFSIIVFDIKKGTIKKEENLKEKKNSGRGALMKDIKGIKYNFWVSRFLKFNGNALK